MQIIKVSRDFFVSVIDTFMTGSHSRVYFLLQVTVKNRHLHCFFPISLSPIYVTAHSSFVRTLQFPFSELPDKSCDLNLVLCFVEPVELPRRKVPQPSGLVTTLKRGCAPPQISLGILCYCSFSSHSRKASQRHHGHSLHIHILESQPDLQDGNINNPSPIHLLHTQV